VLVAVHCASGCARRWRALLLPFIVQLESCMACCCARAWERASALERHSNYTATHQQSDLGESVRVVVAHAEMREVDQGVPPPHHLQAESR
jgi:hypothetical protein